MNRHREKIRDHAANYGMNSDKFRALFRPEKSLKIDHPEAWRVAPGYGEEVTRVLAEQGIRHVSGYYFERSKDYTCWAIADNGGEINVRLVNVWSAPISVPYVEHGLPVDAEELALRIWDAMQGDPPV